MKLSFSLQSKPSTKPNPKFPIEQDDDRHKTTTTTEFVTEFDSTKPLATKTPNFIIPPIQNEWRPIKRMKNLQNLPTLQSDGSRGLEFETESISATDHPDDNISYGLNIRTADQNGDVVDGKGAVRSYDNNLETIMLQKLRRDLDRLPDDRGMEEFEDMPVEGFGAALLAGYGWTEGKGIGKNAKEDTKVIEIKKRTAKEGLGFDSSIIKNAIDKNNNQSQSTNSRSRRNDEKEKEKEKLKEKYRDGYSVGINVRVITGCDMGLEGTILDRLSADKLILKLSKTKEEVKVCVKDIALLGSKEEDRCLRKLKELKIQEEKGSKQSSSRDSKKSVSKRSRDIGEVKSEGVNRKTDKLGASWLRSHIRVRIISKDLGGRFYLKKAEVIDVVGPTTCDISIDETKELIQGVDQEFLETALPKRGGPVLVLYGKHKGVYGNLVEKDLDRETGVVRDADSHDLLKVKLEQIAEYMGDPSYLGY